MEEYNYDKMDFFNPENNYEERDFLNVENNFANDDSYFYDKPFGYGVADARKDLFGSNHPSKSWLSFQDMAYDKKIKILRKGGGIFGWFQSGETIEKEDIKYTFERYKKEISNQIRQKELKKEELSRISIESEENSRRNMILNFKDKFLRTSKNKKIYDLLKKYKWIDYDEVDLENKLELYSLSSDPYNSMLRDAEKYYKEQLKDYENNLKHSKKKDKLERQRQFLKNFYEDLKSLNPVFFQKMDMKKFVQDNPGLISIYKDFMLETKEQLDGLLNHLFVEKNLPANEAKDYLIEEARRKYNFMKDEYNQNVENYSQLSSAKKEITKNLGQLLDAFLRDLKPFVEDYKARNESRDKAYREQIQAAERKAIQQKEAERKRIEAQKKAEMKKLQEEEEDLNYRILDAQSKYSMKKAKLRKLQPKLAKLKNLQSMKVSLTEKLKNTNLKIAERKNLLEKRTEIDEKLKNLDSLKSQIETLKSQIPSVSVFQNEKDLRLQELDKLKKLNETQIREKNALLRSVEFEKMKEEIRLREEQRYQQEQRLKRELEAAEKVYLQEKAINDKKILSLKRKTILDKNKRDDLLDKIPDLKDQKKILSKLKSEREKQLQQKKWEIEKKKLAQRKIVQDKADEQKLFQDSLALDVSELESRKQILNEISTENKKTLANTKTEISNRQKEIEKTIQLNMKNISLQESKLRQEESKIKLNVFETLGDIKDEISKNEDIEQNVQQTLSDMKDEIIRKQDVYDVLQDTIVSIENSEIAEIEEQNTFLESEIAVKKKLADENLTNSQRIEILVEEKEDIIDHLENVKSRKLKEIYELRERAIESQMKILLTEGAEDLKSRIFSLKYEIKDLETRKTLNEEKEDFAKFQLDNFKKELKLRKQEIDLLKNIREKTLETEKKQRDTETRKAIADIVHRVEDEQIQDDVREKLDEILDDVEDEDFDFLEDDELDTFISDVRKHLSGEKKIQLDKITPILSEAREESSKLKMDENIEMKNYKPQVGPEDYEVGETSFGDWSGYDYNLFVSNIENFEMRENVRKTLADINADEFEEDNLKPEKMKDSYKKAINDAWKNDKLDTDYWDGSIILGERAKFDYEQKINNLNTALVDYNLHLDPTDQRFYRYSINKFFIGKTGRNQRIYIPWGKNYFEKYKSEFLFQLP